MPPPQEPRAPGADGTALSVLLLQGANGLPLGVQLVGPRHSDTKLLRTARWLVAKLAT